MTEQEADAILAKGFRPTSLDGFLGIHEALLVKRGVPELERAAIMLHITAAYGRVSR